MPQQSLRENIADLEKAGLVVRIKDEKRVDELPMIMENNPGPGSFGGESQRLSVPLLCQRLRG